MLHERLRRVLAEMVVYDPEGGAIDYGREVVSTGKGGHGSHRGSSEPPRVSPLAQEWAGHFARLLDLAELDLARLRGTAPKPEPMPANGGKPSLVAARKRRIVSDPLYRGRPAAFVAYAEGCSEDTVRRARADRGLDSYGLPVKRDALTAPARHALKLRPTSATTTTEDPA